MAMSSCSIEFSGYVIYQGMNKVSHKIIRITKESQAILYLWFCGIIYLGYY